MIKSDAKQVFAIEKKCFSQPWSESDFEKTVDDDNYLYLTALDSDKVVGYAGLVMSIPEGDITNIAVDYEYRHLGIGEQLLTSLITLGCEKGLEDIYLEVRESNENAINLYKKAGFEQIGIRKNFYQLPSENALLMSKKIKILD